MNYILSYDITSDKLRLKISKRLETLGCFRIQKSVFIGSNFSIKEIQLLKASILTILSNQLKTDNDSFICLPMTQNQKLALWWLKPNPSPEFDFDWSIWI